jgi:pyruvate dehydrogenase E1 component
LAPTPSDPAERELLRADVLAGGYVLRDAERDARVLICAVGAMVQEAVEAAETLEEGGVGARVVCLSSPDLIYQAIRAERGFGDMDSSILERVFPAAEPLPIVGVIDGHPQALAFLEDIHRTGSTCLGVTEFGQSGDIADLYRHHRIDAESIIGAALDLI